MFFEKLTLVMIIVLGLAGCDQKNTSYTYDYLMEHPLVVKSELAKCDALGMQSYQSPQCKIVYQAAEDITNMLNNLQRDPEQLGQQILTTEIELAKLKSVYTSAQENLKTLQDKKANPAEISAAQDKVDQAKQPYLNKHKELRILLAIVGMNSPE